jgi:hypothetical protein
MFNPKYRILITSKCFPEDGVVGLGTQLISILNSVKNYLAPHIWCAADVEAVGKNAEKQNLSSIQITLIGNDLQFIEYCSGIEQFIWGVFLCVDKKYSSQNIIGVQLETEDNPFRSVDSNGILMEIRAFDTTYFEIYAENLELITKTSKQYGISIEQTK